MIVLIQVALRYGVHTAGLGGLSVEEKGSGVQQSLTGTSRAIANFAPN